MREVVPGESPCLLLFLGGDVADAFRGKTLVSEHLDGQRGVNGSRGAVRVWDWKAIPGRDGACLLRWKSYRA